MEFKARSVEECWKIARKQAETYQLLANDCCKNSHSRSVCLAMRDAVDRLALTIRYGRAMTPKEAEEFLIRFIA